MPQTANTLKLAADLPTALVIKFRQQAAEHGGVTAVLTRFVREFTGQAAPPVWRIRHNNGMYLADEAEITWTDILANAVTYSSGDDALAEVEGAGLVDCEIVEMPE